ncbi:MAG: hypothetical protein HMLKMBBP_00705 [Planctomycetes bacterium]|nr:hypothetical protein [Planctomycetota bacterium]
MPKKPTRKAATRKPAKKPVRKVAASRPKPTAKPSGKKPAAKPTRPAPKSAVVPKTVTSKTVAPKTVASKTVASKTAAPKPTAPKPAATAATKLAPAAKGKAAAQAATPTKVATPQVAAPKVAAAKPTPAKDAASAKPAAQPGGAAAAPAAPKPAESGKGRKPKPPAKTMSAPAPVTEVLLKRDLPDVRRVAGSSMMTDAARGLTLPNQPARAREPISSEQPPVDAKLIATSLAADSAPKIEDNYDYTVLEEFAASRLCPSPTRMVNTGCGGGEASVFFAKRGFSVVAIDSDRTAVGLARERAWLAGAEIDFMVGDLFETPNLLPAESFGLAVDRGAFNRMVDERDRQRFLANTKRLLFKGGVFLLSAGFFELPGEPKGAKRRPPQTKLLLVREGGVVVNEVRQAGFDVAVRSLKQTADSGDYGELLLYLVK